VVDFTTATAIPLVYANDSKAFNGTGDTNTDIEKSDAKRVAAGNYYAKVVLVSATIKEEFSTDFVISAGDVTAAVYSAE
jgi:hypothetical protein